MHATQCIGRGYSEFERRHLSCCRSEERETACIDWNTKKCECYPSLSLKSLLRRPQWTEARCAIVHCWEVSINIVTLGTHSLIQLIGQGQVNPLSLTKLLPLAFVIPCLKRKANLR